MTQLFVYDQRENASCVACGREQPLQLRCRHSLCAVCASKSILRSRRPLAVLSRKVLPKLSALNFVQNGNGEHHDPDRLRYETHNDPNLLRVYYPILDKKFIPPLGSRYDPAMVKNETLIGHRQLYGERSIVSKTRPLAGIPNVAIDSHEMEQRYAWPPEWYSSDQMKDEFWVNESNYNIEINSSFQNQPIQHSVALTCPECKVVTYLEPQVVELFTSLLSSDESLSLDDELCGIAPLDLSSYMRDSHSCGLTSRQHHLGDERHGTTTVICFGKQLHSNNYESLTSYSPFPKGFKPPPFSGITSRSAEILRSSVSPYIFAETTLSVSNHYPYTRVPDWCGRCRKNTCFPSLRGTKYGIPRKDIKLWMSSHPNESPKLLSQVKSLTKDSLFYCSQCVEYVCWDCAKKIHRQNTSTATHTLVLVDGTVPIAQQSDLARGRPIDQEEIRQITHAPSDISDIASIESTDKEEKDIVYKDPISVFSMAAIRQHPSGVEERDYLSELQYDGMHETGRFVTNLTTPLPSSDIYDGDTCQESDAPPIFMPSMTYGSPPLETPVDSETMNAAQGVNSSTFTKNIKDNEVITGESNPAEEPKNTKTEKNVESTKPTGPIKMSERAVIDAGILRNPSEIDGDNDTKRSIISNKTLSEIRNCGTDIPFSSVSDTCPQHSKQPAQFFCLECYTQCFCGLCLVDGQHVKHEVLPVNEAWSVIKERCFKTEIQTALEELVEDSLQLEPAIHAIRKSKMEVVDSTKENIEKCLSAIVKKLQDSEISLITTAQEILDVSCKEVQEHLEHLHNVAVELSQLNEELHMNTVIHNNRKLCEYYHKNCHPPNSQARVVLEDRNNPKHLRPVVSSGHHRIHFYVESSYTLLAALNQTADYIKEFPVRYSIDTSGDEGIIEDTALLGVLQDLEFLTHQLTQETVEETQNAFNE